jgi:hypothetical protein
MSGTDNDDGDATSLLLALPMATFGVSPRGLAMALPVEAEYRADVL